MRISVTTLAACALLLNLESAVYAQVSFAIRIGEPPPPRVYSVAPQPGPDFVWVEGYWYPQGRQDVWHDAYLDAPAYEGAYWIVAVRPRWPGTWPATGTRPVAAEHDHRWDRERDRRDDRREEWREDWREEHPEEYSRTPLAD